MASSTKIERILAPAGGLNTNDSPSAIPKEQAPQLRNWIPGQNGRLGGRVPVRMDYASGFDIFTAGLSTTGGFTDADVVYTAVGNNLFFSIQSDGSFINGTTIAGLRARQSAGFAVVNDRIYIYDQGVSPTIMHEVTDAGADVAFSASTPRNGLFTFTYLNALWVFGARDTPAASTTDETSTLFYSNPGTALTDAASVWQTTVGGITTTNKITIGTKTGTNDYAVGAIPFNRSLLLLKRSSIYQLVGDGPDNFTLRTISTVTGCRNARSICATDRAVYFSSQNGVQRWDGSTLTRIGLAVRPSLTNISDITAIGDSTLLISNSTDSYIYDERTETFTEIRLNVNEQDLSISNIAEASQAVTSGGLVRIIKSPSASSSTHNAIIRTTNQYQFAIIHSTLGMDGRQTISPSPLFHSDLGAKELALTPASTYGSADASIEYYWRSRLIRSSSPLSGVRLANIFVDYVCQARSLSDAGTSYSPVTTDDSDAPPFLYVKVSREDGTTILPETPLPSQGSTTALQRRRFITSLQNVEASEYYVEIYSKPASNLKLSPSYSGSNLVSPLASTLAIHDVWVEYEPAQRRSAV